MPEITDQERAVLEAARVIAADLADRDPDLLDANERELLHAIGQLDGSSSRPQEHEEPPLRRLVREVVTLRRHARLSQAVIAERLGVTQTAVSYWESHERDIPVDKLAEYAEVVGHELRLVPASEMFPRELAERLTGAVRTLLAKVRDDHPMTALGGFDVLLAAAEAELGGQEAS